MKAISADQLKDDEEYQEIVEDMREECGKFGIYVNVFCLTPLPCHPNHPHTPLRRNCCLHVFFLLIKCVDLVSLTEPC